MGERYLQVATPFPSHAQTVVHLGVFHLMRAKLPDRSSFHGIPVLFKYHDGLDGRLPEDDEVPVLIEVGPDCRNRLFNGIEHVNILRAARKGVIRWPDGEIKQRPAKAERGCFCPQYMRANNIDLPIFATSHSVLFTEKSRFLALIF